MRKPKSNLPTGKPRTLGRPEISPERLSDLRNKIRGFLGTLPPEAGSREEALKLAETRLDLKREEIKKSLARRLEKLESVADTSPIEEKLKLSKKLIKLLPDETHRRMWEERAKNWVRIEKRQVFLATLDSILRNVELKPNDSIASLGSGNGVFETFIAKEIIPKGRMTCVDYAKNMNIEARNLARANGAKNVGFVTGAMDRIPLASDSQDVVMSINSLQWVKNWRRAISEMRRIMKKTPDSRAVISVNHFEGSHQRANWGGERLVAQLRRQGFSTLHGTSFVTESQTRDGPFMRDVIVAKIDPEFKQ